MAEMGRRAGLKILWSSSPCGFESHSGHSSEDSMPGCEDQVGFELCASP